jgi:mono/diheme cytochrome c family protein
MNIPVIAGVVVIVQGCILASAQSKTTQDGVYTDAQATRGESIYAKTCASCHANDLSGSDPAPSLTGKDFNADWNDLSIGDLFERVRATMPGDAPGSLKPGEVADVIAFVLSKGGFPAGQAELASDPGTLKQLTYVAPKP